MSRVAVLCALLLLGACGSASTTSSGSSSTGSPSASTTTTASTSPSVASSATSSAPPAGVWTGLTASDQFTQALESLYTTKSKSIELFNAFGRADLPADDAFAAAFAPVAQACVAAQQAATAATGTLVADHQAGHWSPQAWQAMQKALKEIRWWAHTQKGCGAIKTKPDLLAWTVGMDIKRATALSDVLAATSGDLLSS